MYSGPKIRSPQCLLTLYPESQQVAIKYAIQNFTCAYALHDKDRYSQQDEEDWLRCHPGESFPHIVGELKKPHYHFIMTFPGSGRYFHAIAKELNVPMNTICRCNSLFRAYEYLSHKNTPDKFQYDPSIVKTSNGFVIPTATNGRDDEEEQVRLLLDMPLFDTSIEAARWAWENHLWAAYRRAYPIFRDIRFEMRGRR